jgi:hypothetical protein
MRKPYLELVLGSIAQRIRTEIGTPMALNAPLVAALEDLKGIAVTVRPAEEAPAPAKPGAEKNNH